jgi:hypothetical protein
LELAFCSCEIDQNYEIRLKLSEVYTKQGLKDKALSILQDPVPPLDLRAKQAMTLASLTNFKSRKRARNHDDDQILISSDEDGGKSAKFVSNSGLLIPEQEGIMPYRKV